MEEAQAKAARRKRRPPPPRAPSAATTHKPTVCPVDCCIPDENNVESEDILLSKQKFMHPEE